MSKPDSYTEGEIDFNEWNHVIFVTDRDGDNPNELVHSVLFKEHPRQTDIDHVRQELRTDTDHGLSDKKNLEFTIPTRDIFDRWVSWVSSE